MLTLITTLAALLRALITYADKKQLLDAGEARGEARAASEALAKLGAAVAARRRVAGADPERLRDDDGFRRD
ncbi:MAG: hypothetical protein AAF580_13380 [Pseudomonadota bacterium]